MSFVKVFDADELPEGSGRFVEVGDEWLAIFHVQGGFFAIDDTCTHAQASLSEGELEGYVIICPRHGGRFDVRTGKAVGPPAVDPVRTYPLKIEAGEVFVDVGGWSGLSPTHSTYPRPSSGGGDLPSEAGAPSPPSVPGEPGGGMKRG